MFNKKMQYVIKSVPTDDKQALEDLLNEIEKYGDKIPESNKNTANLPGVKSA